MNGMSHGALYRLAEGVFCLRYQPVPDFHFPLGLMSPPPLSLLGWSIAPAETGKPPVYLVVLCAIEPGYEPELCSIVLETQFGAHQVEVLLIEPSDALPSSERAEAINLVLRHAASLPRDRLLALAQSLLSDDGVDGQSVALVAGNALRLDLDHFVTCILVNPRSDAVIFEPASQQLVQVGDQFILEVQHSDPEFDVAMVSNSEIIAFWHGGYKAFTQGAGG